VLRTLKFVEKPVSTRDGRWFNIRIMAYRTFDDKIDGLVITFIEITKSKQLENILQQHQLTLRSFIQTVPSVILGLSSDGKVIEFNPEAEKVFACKSEDVMGKKYVDLFIPKTSREEVEVQMKKLLSGGLPNRFVNIVQALNGTHLKIEWSAHQLLDDAGKLTGIIAIGLQITQP